MIFDKIYQYNFPTIIRFGAGSSKELGGYLVKNNLSRPLVVTDPNVSQLSFFKEIINDLKNATYYARVIIRVENELHQKKIIELDGRPSDCIAMATQQKAPIYVSQDVWDEVDDMSDVLRKMEEEGLKPDPETDE